MSTSSVVRKVVSVPVYAAVLSTMLVACGTVTVKEERRAKGLQSATAAGNADSTATEQAKRDGDIAAVNRGLALTLPAEMPKTVDTVSITLISELKSEPVPVPAPVQILPADIKPEPTKILPCSYYFGNGGGGLPIEGCGGGDIGGLLKSLPWHNGLQEKHPLAAAGISQAAHHEKDHHSKAHHEKAAIKSKKHGPAARVGKGQAIQPVAFVPLHWLDDTRPAGSCGLGSDLKDNDPLAAFLDSDAGTNISFNTLNYYFGSDQKEFAVEDLEPGTYVVVIELIDSKTGKVIESGETKVVVEAGKVAAAKVKLTTVPATTGGVVITVERAPTAAVTQTKK
ncbi:MAG: hypothetical protein FJ146_09515 [Deltaproteobacteria bacterium]|nr:hypothetical protein [Deltaproteobacteria bacterium]